MGVIEYVDMGLDHRAGTIKKSTCPCDLDQLGRDQEGIVVRRKHTLEIEVLPLNHGLYRCRDGHIHHKNSVPP